MKIIKVVLIAILVLVFLAGLGGFIFIKTFDVNRFKPQILSQLSKSLGRQVNFENAKLAFSFSQGISLKIDNLVLSDDQAFQKGDFLSVESISLAVDILGYLLQKKVTVSHIAIDVPRVLIIRRKDGALNVSSIGKSLQPPAQGRESYVAPAAMALPVFLISSLKGSNGRITYLDHSYDPPLRLEISALSFAFSKISLSDAFPFQMNASVFSVGNNVSLAGKAQIDLAKNELTLSECRLTADLSEIQLDKISSSLPMVGDNVLPSAMKGRIAVVAQKLVAGGKGLISFSGDATMVDGFLQLKEIASAISDIKTSISFTEKNILLKEFSAAIGEGVINATGSLDNYTSSREYRIEADIQKVKLQEVIDGQNAPVKAEGVVSSKLAANGSGLSERSLRTNLSGKAQVSVTAAKLKDINLLRAVLDKISVIPKLSQKIEEGLPQKFKDALTQPDTNLSDVQLPVTIENGKLSFMDAAIGGDEFMFKGNGEAGFDGSYQLEGSFLIPQELSTSMVGSVAELRYLLNDAKEIYIPLKISGKAGDLAVDVDAEYIGKKLLLEQAQKQIFKALDKYLGPKEQAPLPGEGDLPVQGQHDPAATQPSQPPPPGEKSSLEEAVGGMLDKILGK